MQIHENDREPSVAGQPLADQNDAARDMLAAWREAPVVTIELTPEQQALLARQTGGRIDATALKLRPSLNLRAFLSEVAEIDTSDLATSIAPPPKGTAWAITGTL